MEDRAGFEAALSARMHEIRNPIASIQGAAETLAKRGDSLDPAIREGLATIILRQARRLDWLVTALASPFRPPEADGRTVADTARAAALAAAVPVTIEPGVPDEPAPAGLSLAYAALLLAFLGRGEEGEAVLGEDGVLRIRSSARDLEDGERAWKVDVARRLLAGAGCRLDVITDGESSRVDVAPPAGERRTA